MWPGRLSKWATEPQRRCRSAAAAAAVAARGSQRSKQLPSSGCRGRGRVGEWELGIPDECERELSI